MDLLSNQGFRDGGALWIEPELYGSRPPVAGEPVVKCGVAASLWDNWGQDPGVADAKLVHRVIYRASNPQCHNSRRPGRYRALLLHSCQYTSMLSS